MPKILIVDDEPLIRDALSFKLKKEGYDVDTAEDGETALRSARENLPDAVILDLMLPGDELAAMFRRYPGKNPVADYKVELSQ